MLKIRVNGKKLLVFAAMTALLFLFHGLVIGDDVIILGLISIIISCIFNLPCVGWFAVFAYPLTYVAAALRDTPAMNGTFPNNLYVFWYFGYFFAIVAGLVIDFYIKYKRRQKVDCQGTIDL